MWSNKSTASSIGLFPGRRTIGPLFLMLITPPFAITLWYLFQKTDPSLLGLYNEVVDQYHGNVLAFLMAIWPSPTVLAAKFVLGFFALQLLLIAVIPGPTYYGPITPAGNRPAYVDNGVACFLATLATLGGIHYFEVFPLGLAYDEFGPIVSFLNAFSLSLCVFLYFKGAYFPSSSDASTSGNPVFDYYWGTELYPRIFGFDVKRITNCRFGLMVWPSLLICYAAKQAADHHLTNTMIVSVVIQLIYCFKFFLWETGYLSSIDIMHDRAGFYLCWGCCVWVPTLYTSPTFYLVKHGVDVDFTVALFIAVAGIACVMINYAADRQRQEFRASNGKARIWGQPAQFITASYTTEDGEKKTSLLLLSGWWGLARHFHYVPEILGAFFWSAGAGFQHVMPYFYTIFLTILLVDRSFRDEARCAYKYGKDWEKYRERVPQRIIPYIF